VEERERERKEREELEREREREDGDWLGYLVRARLGLVSDWLSDLKARNVVVGCGIVSSVSRLFLFSLISLSLSLSLSLVCLVLGEFAHSTRRSTAHAQPPLPP
jgi:hypothetical protein